MIFGRAKASIDLKKGQFLYLNAEREDGVKVSVPTTIYLKVTDDGKVQAKKTKKQTFAKDVTFAPFDLLIAHPEILDLSVTEFQDLLKYVEDKKITPKYVAVFSTSSGKSCFVIDEKDIKIDVKLIEAISKTEEKTVLKAYETPTQGMEIVFKPLLKQFYKHFQSKVLDSIYMRMKQSIIAAQNVLPKNAVFSFNEVKRAVNFFTKEEFEEMRKNGEGFYYSTEEKKLVVYKPESKEQANANKNITSFIIKYYDALKVATTNPDSEPIGALLEKLRIEAEKINVKLPEFSRMKIPVIDYQAGSGRHLKVFEKEQFPAVLFGTELRQLEAKDENNKVIYGVDFDLFKDYFEHRLSNTAVKRSIFYLNPPYTTGGYLEKESVKFIPEGSIFLGVFSTKVKDYLLNNISGFVFEVPKEAVGYDDPNTPENFLLVFGVKKERGNSVFMKFSEKDPLFYQKKIEEAFASKKLDYQVAVSLMEGKIKELIDYFYSKDNEKRLSFIEEAFTKSVNELNTVIRNGNFIKETLEDNSEKIFSYFSPVSKAVAGAEIFPDMRFFGEKPYLSIYQVANNIPLLTFYKNNYPSLYHFVQQVAEKARIKLPKLKEDKGKEYVTTENLGVMKLRYYPKTIPVTDEVISVIVKLLEEKREERNADGKYVLPEDTRKKITENIKNVQKLSKIADKIILKSVTESFALGDSVNFGYTSILAFVDRFGQDLAAISIPLAKFYERLEEKGIIDVKNKYEVAKPDKDMKRRLVLGYVNHIEWIKERYGITNVSEKFTEYNKALKNRAIGKFLADFLKETALVEKLKEDVAAVIPSVDVIRQKVTAILNAYQLQSSGISLKIAQGVSELYEKAPKKFYEGRKEFSENLVRNIVKTHLPEDIKSEIVDDVVSSVFEGIAEHYAILDSVRTGALKLTLEFFEAERMKRLLQQKNDVESAYKTFEKLFRRFLGIRPHQYNEAIRFLAKYEKTEEGGHLLGWEMRSGKTLAMLSIGYFGGLIYGKDTYFFPKTANVNDIIYQAVAFMPSLTTVFRAYESGDLDVSVVSKRVRRFVSDNVFPNIFAFVSSSRHPALKGNKIFVGRGNTVSMLLKSYAKDMEELINIAKTRGFSFDEDIDETKPYAFVKDLDGYDDAVKMATYWYLERLEKEGLLDVSNVAGFNALKESMERFCSQLSAYKKKLAEEEPFPFTFHIVPKGQLLALNYRIPVDRKEEAVSSNLKIGTLSFVLKKDFSLVKNNYMTKEELVENSISSDFDDYYIAPEAKIKAYLVEAFGEDVLNFLKFEEKELISVGSTTFKGVKISLKEDEELPEKAYDTFADIQAFCSEKFISYEKLYKSFFAYMYDNMKYDININLSTLAFGLTEAFPDAELMLEKNPDVTFYGLKLYSFPYEWNAETEQFKVVSILDKKVDYNKPSEVAYEFPEEFDCSVKISAKTLKRQVDVSIIADSTSKDAREIFLSSETSARNYLVHSEFFADKKGEIITIVDEADEASDPSAATYRAIYYVARNSILKVGGTGTPTSGYPETIAALMGLVADAPLSSVTGTMQVIKDSFSLSEISADGAKAIPYLILETLNTTDRKESFVKDLLNFSFKGGDVKDKADSFLELFSRYNTDFNGNAVNLFLSYVIDDLREKINPFVFSGKAMKFLKNTRDFIEKQNASITDLNVFKFAVTETAKRMGYIKRAAGTFDPIGYISSLEGASFSLNTRQALKSESAGREIKEVKNFDNNNLLEVYEKMKNIGYIKDSVSSEDFAPYSLHLRIFTDVEVENYKKQTGLPILWDYISANLQTLIKAVEKNPKLLLENLRKNAVEKKSLTREEIEKFILARAKEVNPDKAAEVEKVLSRYGETIFSRKYQDVIEVSINAGGEKMRCLYLVGKGRGRSLPVFAVNLDEPQFSEHGLVSYSDYVKAVFYGSSFLYRKEEENMLMTYRIGDNITERDVKNAIARSTKSAQDDVYSIIKHYVQNGFNWSKTISDMQISDETKIEVAKAVWNEFVQTFIKDYPKLLQKVEEHKQKNKGGKKVPLKIKTRSGYTVTPYITQVVNSQREIVEFGFTGAPGEELITAPFAVVTAPSMVTLKEEPVVFSKTVTFYRSSWEEILKDEAEKGLSYRYNYLSPADYEIIDSFSNKGYYERIVENTFNGKNYLLTSPRIYSFMVGVFDAVAAAYESKMKGENTREIHFLVRASTKLMKDIFSRIDVQKLEKAGIYFKLFKNNADLDGESKKLKKILKSEEKRGESKTQLIVAATDETIARGVDLSHLDEMVVLGANNSGKTASQLFARLFNATDKHEASIYIAGKPYKIVRDLHDNEKLAANGSFYKVTSLLAKTKFIDDIISGTLINIANTSSAALRILEAAKTKLKEIDLIDPKDPDSIDDILDFYNDDDDGMQPA